MTERRSVVAIRHVAFEDLGLMAGLLDPDLFDVAYCEAATDALGHRSIRAADLVIVLGGPIGVGDARHYGFLSDEIALIESRLTRGKPTLGICLGAQLMAAALGDWHGDTFDLPRNARRLAFNGNYQNQAFALGRNAVALQFH